MANKTLHSLQFPGLSDVYVVPEDAQEFSSESTYAVGEFVTYQGVLYKCTTAVTTAGSWTGATNWSATDVGTELQDTYGPSRPNFSVNNPVMDGSASPGSATTYARSDHVHPSDTSKLDIPENSGTAGQVLTKTLTGSIWQTQGSGGEIIAAASNSYSVTLYANSWTTQEQLIATPTGAEITSTSDGVLGLSPNATAAQVEAFQLAKIIVISQSSSGVVVKALGIVPTINLPCELMIFMKADYYTKDYIDTYMAPLDTPTFIGVPKAPTAAAGTNTTQIATTAFVEQAKNTRVPVYGLGKNLLDNWYFLNPVNQRGQSSYNANGSYTIDRWYLNAWRAQNIAATIDTAGITLSQTATNANTIFLAQKIDGWQQFAGKTVTVSILVTSLSGKASAFLFGAVDGTRYLSSGMTVGLNTFTVTLPNDITGLQVAFGHHASAGGSGAVTLTISAVKLELGTEQTLCHNEGTAENPVWVLNELPDYGEELAKCQRYLYPVFKGSNDFGIYPHTVRSQVINGAPQGYARIQIIKPDMYRGTTPTIVNTFPSFRLVIVKLSDSSTASLPTLTVDSTVLAGSPSMWISFVTSSNITSYLNGDYGFEIDTYGNNGYLFISTEP